MNKLAIVALLLAVSPSFAQETPQTMTAVVVRSVEAGREPNTFIAQPKKYWRAGTKYARVEEAPDTANGIHGLLIISEPDAWLINLLDKSGRHVVDRGPTFNARLPIFNADTGISPTVMTLEFGRELEFFNKNNANAKRSSENIGGKATDRYELTIDNSTLILWTGVESKKPFRVSLIHDDKTQTFEYLSYQDNLGFDSSLFRPPTGIAIAEAK